MNVRISALVLFVSVMVGGLQADEPVATPSDTKPAAEPARPATQPKLDSEALIFQLMDGSTISGRLDLKEIQIDTQFGNLVVPVASIKSVTPGMGSHPELAKNIETLIRNLGSANFSEREAAQRALSKLGSSVRSELQRNIEDPDTERRTRIKTLLDEFDQVEASDDDDDKPAASLGLIQRDMVETTDFTIVGKISPASFGVVTLYGPLTLKLSDVQRAGRGIVEREDVRKSLSVEGSNIVQRNFKNSGVRLEKGDKLSVTAGGTVTMMPWGNQTMSSPDGLPNCGWYVPNQIASGTLVGRIGSSGPVFKVGAKNSIVADRAGVLYLAIAMEPNYASNVFPGEYQVKLHVQRK